MLTLVYTHANAPEFGEHLVERSWVELASCVRLEAGDVEHVIAMYTPEEAKVDDGKKTHKRCYHGKDEGDAGEVCVDGKEGAPFDFGKGGLRNKLGSGGIVEETR